MPEREQNFAGGRACTAASVRLGTLDAFYTGKDVVRIYGEPGAARWKALRG